MGKLQGRLITKYRPQQPVEALKDAEPESLEQGVREKWGNEEQEKISSPQELQCSSDEMPSMVHTMVGHSVGAQCRGTESKLMANWSQSPHVLSWACLSLRE